MKKRIRWALCLALIPAALMLSGCLFNIFQTARMIGAGNMAVTIGTGLMDIVVDEDPNWNLTPQARLTFGLSDTVNLGFQTGAMVPLSTGDFGWMGAKGDLTFSIIDDPESVSLAMGFGGGYGVEFLNWGVFGEILLNVNSTLPIFLAYQPTIPLQGDGFVIWHHIAGGLALPISETSTLILIVDYRNGLYSFGLALEIAF